ncbi:MAG: hypothetical protein MK160_08180, partial [Rhodobacteraceae bacterium]|nr:hypothetical protein [Paracoccaceae bacterium]
DLIHRRGPWPSFDAVKYATLEWVDRFNNRRLTEPIGDILPAEAEANVFAALEHQTWPCIKNKSPAATPGAVQSQDRTHPLW